MNEGTHHNSRAVNCRFLSRSTILTMTKFLRWYNHGTAQHGSGKLARRHWFPEQQALGRVEAHLTHAIEVVPSLHAFRNGPCPDGIGEIENLTASRAFQAIVRTAGDELSIDLDLHKRERSNVGE